MLCTNITSLRFYIIQLFHFNTIKRKSNSRLSKYLLSNGSEKLRYIYHLHNHFTTKLTLIRIINYFYILFSLRLYFFGCKKQKKKKFPSD